MCFCWCINYKPVSQSVAEVKSEKYSVATGQAWYTNGDKKETKSKDNVSFWRRKKELIKTTKLKSLSEELVNLLLKIERLSELCIKRLILFQSSASTDVRVHWPQQRWAHGQWMSCFNHVLLWWKFWFLVIDKNRKISNIFTYRITVWWKDLCYVRCMCTWHI